MISSPKLTLSDARIIADACENASQELGQDMDIAVTDDGGNLLYFQRMDNARISSAQIAIDKAWTAATARKSTRDYGTVSQPGSPTFGINTSNGGRFSIIAGGLPIFVNERIVGGIGCSSGTPDQDEQIAKAGLDALLQSLDH